MPDTRLYTQEAALQLASDVKTALVASKLRFIKDGLVITQYTTKDQLLALECDFDGYTAGGYALATWSGPLIYNSGGAIITAPMVNVTYNTPSDPPVGNLVGGWWIEDAAGHVRFAGNYDPTRALNSVGQGFSVVNQIVYGVNPQVTFASG